MLKIRKKDFETPQVKPRLSKAYSILLIMKYV